MAHVHNQLSRGPWSNAIKAALGDRKAEGGVERFGETLDPIINLWGMPEWAFLRGERLAAMRMFAAAVAGEFAIIALGNPAGSNVLVVVDAIGVVGSSSSQSYLLEVAADTLVAGTLTAPAFPAVSRDRRNGGAAGTATAFVRTGNDANNTFGAQLEQMFHVVTTAAVAALVATPLVLRPGDDLLVIAQTVNTSFTALFNWRERRAFPSELTP